LCSDVTICNMPDADKQSEACTPHEVIECQSSSTMEDGTSVIQSQSSNMCGTS